MKCTISQLDTIINSLDGSLLNVEDLLSEVLELDYRLTSNKLNIDDYLDQEDWDYIYEATEECGLCGWWAMRDSMETSKNEDIQICWRCAEQEEEENAEDY